jgi:outer membrane protein assembly factor BamA
MDRLSRIAAPARALAAALLVAAGAARAEPPVAGPAAAAPATAPGAASGELPRVAAIELRLPPGEDATAAAGLVALEVGEPLTSAALRTTVQRLWQGGRFRNVVVRAAPAPVPAGAGAGGAWVRVTVEALPVRLLAGVTLRVQDGPGVAPEPLRAAAKLETGAPFDEGDLDAASARIRALLARRGWREAKVEATATGDLRVAVDLRVLAGEPVRVGAVRLSGDPGPAAAALVEKLATRPGAPLDADALQADAKRLRAGLFAAGYRRARVSAPAVAVEGRTATVELPVDAGPRISFVFRGNDAIPSTLLQRELGFEEGLPVDVPAVGAAEDRLAAFYRARGFAAARVESHEVRRGRDLALAFHVEEGRRFRLARVEVQGLAWKDERWVRERLAALLDQDGSGEDPAAESDDARVLAASIPGVTPRGAPPPALLPHEALDGGAWDRAAERLVDEWRAQGFLEAVYLGASTRLDGRRAVAELTLRFREGPRTLVEAISFEGNSAVALPDLAREARVAPGDPLAFEKVEATRAALLRVYLSRGFLFAHVEAREQMDRDRHVASVRFVVEEGPQVRVGRVLLTGHHRLKESVVRKQLTLAEGDVVDPDQLAKSQAALLRLNVFRSVSLRMQDPEVPQKTKDLAVEMVEGPWATLSSGVGFSIANGPRAQLEWTQPDFLDRALELSAHGKVNYPLVVFRPDLAGKDFGQRIEAHGDAGVRAPGLPFVSLPGAARTGVTADLLHRRAYDLKRYSALAGVDAGLFSRVTASLQYDLEVDDISKNNTSGYPLTEEERKNLQFAEGVTTLNVLRPTVTLDYRDNSVNPHTGWYGTAWIEWAHSLGTAGERMLFGLLPGSEHPTNELKTQLSASSYFPVGATVLALGARFGRIIPLSDLSETIVPRRFFLGGATTMRGYAEETMLPEDLRKPLLEEAKACQAGPTAKGCTENGRRVLAGEQPVSDGGAAIVLGKAELRVPLRGSLEGALFSDVGNLWLDPKTLRLQDVRMTLGFGLRFVTPIGPAALDIGFNVSRDEQLNESLAAVHFNVGVF